MKAIWVASYPKSGNTWVHSVIRRAGVNKGFPQGELDVYNLIRKGAPFPVCGCVSSAVTEEPCTVLKTHAAFSEEISPHSDAGLDTVAFVHVYRNPLDVLLSYINFTRLEYKSNGNNEAYKDSVFKRLLGMSSPVEYDKWKDVELEEIPRENLDHALMVFGDDDLRIATLSVMSGSWIENTDSWWTASARGKGVSIRYEDCLADSTTFQKVLPLFSFDVEDLRLSLEHVNRAVKSIKTGGTNADQSIFYNKMRSYYFREFFSESVIDRFLGKHEAVLRKFGYEELLL